jgi:hypothetical protein
MATADLEDLWRKVRVSIAAIMIQLEVPQLQVEVAASCGGRGRGW